MAWFRKDRKARQPRRERLEIPPDTWEKCEACGHTDIRDKFQRNLNVCPTCDYHRRVRAWDYAGFLLDEGTLTEVGGALRSVDPLGFPDYPARLKRSLGEMVVGGVDTTIPLFQKLLARANEKDIMDAKQLVEESQAATSLRRGR